MVPEKRKGARRETHRAEIVWRTVDVMGLITTRAARSADDSH